MLWEQLVTDGHVRAARLERVTKPLLIVSTLLLLLGSRGMFLHPTDESDLNPDPAYVVKQKVADIKMGALRPFNSVPPLYMSYAQLEDLPLESELSVVRDRIRQSLDATGEPPAKPAIKVASKPDEFWSWNWPSGLITTRAGNLQAFGTTVEVKPENRGDEMNAQAPHAARWLAVFRKTEKGWIDVAIDATGFTAPPDETRVKPDNIPLSLRQLMGLPEISK